MIRRALGLVATWLLVTGSVVAGDLLVISTSGDNEVPRRVLRFDKTTGSFVGVFATVPDNNPQGMTLGPDGNLYVSSHGIGDPATRGKVFRYDGKTGAFLGLFAHEPATVQAGQPYFGPEGDLYLVDHGVPLPGQHGGVIRFDGVTGTSLGYFLVHESGDTHGASGVLFAEDGSILVASYYTHRILRYDGATGAFIDVFIQLPTDDYPNGPYLGPDGKLYVPSGDITNSIKRFDVTTGAFLDVFVPSGSGGLTFPGSLVWGTDGHLYVASGIPGKVLRYDGTTGAFLGTFVPEGSGGLDRAGAILFMNDPPTANAGADQTVECASQAGALVGLDGSSSTDADGDPLTFLWSVPEGISLGDPNSAMTTGVFPIGNTLATLTVTDGRGGVSTDDVLITVQDTMPPEVLCTTDLAALWPPNHAMVPVAVFVEATDACVAPEDLVLASVTVRSDEPDDASGLGDGATTGDTNGLDGFANPVSVETDLAFNEAAGRYEGMVLLRAERRGTGPGRTYTIRAEVVDTWGNLATAGCVVVVPRDRRNM